MSISFVKLMSREKSPVELKKSLICSSIVTICSKSKSVPRKCSSETEHVSTGIHCSYHNNVTLRIMSVTVWKLQAGDRGDARPLHVSPVLPDTTTNTDSGFLSYNTHIYHYFLYSFLYYAAVMKLKS